MERRFDMSDFEQSLRDQADQFDMVPSKRVWRGIYNNLYPGRRWPSTTVAIAFIITLFTIGHLNNSPKDEGTSRLPKHEQNESLYENTNTVLSNDTKNSDEPVKANSMASGKEYSDRIPGLLSEKNLSENSVNPNQPATQIVNEKNSFTSKERRLVSHATPATIPANLFLNSHNLLAQDYAVVKNNSSSIDKISRADLVINTKVEGNSIFANNNMYDEALSPGGPVMSKPMFSFAHFVTNELSLVDKSSLFTNAIVLEEQDNFLNKISKKIKNAKWMYYLTPSLSSASFRDKDMALNPSNFSLLQNRSFNGMTYNAAFGLKAGAQANHKLFGKLDFITGVDISYSGYNIVSNLVHPTFTTLLFKDNNKTGLDYYSKTYITHYGNGMTQNQISLLNYSLQASVPLGLEYHIWQNEKTQINLMSSIDVSTVLKSNAYIISSDGRYYVKDPSLSRPVNMGINFNPNIVLSGQKIKWHLGPGIRYQLLSRYKNNYPAKEHLIDYGIRIGISR